MPEPTLQAALRRRADAAAQPGGGRPPRQPAKAPAGCGRRRGDPTSRASRGGSGSSQTSTSTTRTSSATAGGRSTPSTRWTARCSARGRRPSTRGTRSSAGAMSPWREPSTRRGWHGSVPCPAGRCSSSATTTSAQPAKPSETGSDEASMTLVIGALYQHLRRADRLPLPAPGGGSGAGRPPARGPAAAGRDHHRGDRAARRRGRGRDVNPAGGRLLPLRSGLPGEPLEIGGVPRNPHSRTPACTRPVTRW